VVRRKNYGGKDTQGEAHLQYKRSDGRWGGRSNSGTKKEATKHHLQTRGALKKRRKKGKHPTKWGTPTFGTQRLE